METQNNQLVTVEGAQRYICTAIMAAEIPLAESITTSDSFRTESPMSSPWSPWQPDESQPWDLRRVVHLYRRAGFAGTWEELQRDLDEGVEASVDRFLNGEVAAQPWDRFEATAKVLSDSAVASGDAARLQAWWMFRMLRTADPLVERLTLMWHNHFATSVEKVTNLLFMRHQNDLLRRHAPGAFGELLHAVLKHPAMLVWLDADSNRRGRPNENLARELMELFTLGEGHYSEDDVREAAKCLTGWTTDRAGKFTIDQDQHEPGPKNVLGEDLESGDDLLALLLRSPPTANRLVWRLCQTFLGENVAGDTERGELAQILSGNDFHIGKTVEVILRSRIFFSAANIGTRVSSPAEFVVATVRRLGLQQNSPSTLILADTLAQMDQELFAPPNVFGWDEGRAWINSRTLVARANFIHALCHGQCHVPPVVLDPRVLVAEAEETTVSAAVLRQRLELLISGESAAASSNQQTTTSATHITQPQAVELAIELLSAPAAQLN